MTPVRRLVVDTASPDPAIIAEAAAALARGELVAFPTETVYGLGAHALDEAAVARIFAAKGRPATNPLIVHGADAASLKDVVAGWPPAADSLAAAFWPGPLTLVLPRAAHVPASVAAGLPAVGVRVPAHPVAQALLRAAALPVAAPSANPYMGLSPTAAAHVEAGLAGSPHPVLLLDGGRCQVGLESTVLDLSGTVPCVLRPGGVPMAALRAVLGHVEVLAAGAAEGTVASPGLAERHYAPRATLHLVSDPSAVRAALEAFTASGARTAALVRTAQGPWPEGARVVEMPGTPEAYGRELYATLHGLDEACFSVVVVEAPPGDEAWAAVTDRLRRAASAP